MQQQGKKALIIAVSKYCHPLEPLPFCVNDGQKMCELLELLDYQIPKNNRLIGAVNYETMREKIIDFFTNAQVKEKDLLLFYFSGHGIPDTDGDNYLGTCEINPTEPYRKGISFDDLTKMMNKSKSNAIITILDCCTSGKADVSRRNQDYEVVQGLANIKGKSEMLHRKRGKYLFAACKSLEDALAEGEHSIFTQYLIQGLNGGEGDAVDAQGIVTPFSLGEYVNDNMATKTKRQSPILKVEASPFKVELARHKEFEQRESVLLFTMLKTGKIYSFNSYRKRKDVRKSLIFKSKDLHNTYLCGVNLSNAILKHSDLSYTKMIKANLRDIDLSMTRLQHADLSRTHLQRAKMLFSDLSSADLSFANLSNSNLSNSNLSKTNLSGANFSTADLSFANLSNTILSGANFSKAKILRANLSSAKARKAKVNLSKAELCDSSVSDVNLSGAHLSGADLYRVNLSDAVLCNANMSSAKLCYANFSYAKLSNTNLSKSNLSYANLSDADLSGANLSGATLYGATLSGARNLSKAKNLFRANLFNCNLPDGITKTLNDKDKLIILGTIPKNGAKECSLTSSISAIFNRPINSSHINESSATFFKVNKVTDKFPNIPGQVSISPDGKTITFMPWDKKEKKPINLGPGKKYTAKITEIKDVGGKTINLNKEWSFNTKIKDPLENLSVSKVIASGHDGNKPVNIIDMNFATRWSCYGTGSWIRIDLGHNEKICALDIAWFKGDKRIYNFKIFTFSDGTIFDNVENKGRAKTRHSSGRNLNYERYNLESSDTRYIQVKVFGNNQSNWASITGLQVYRK